MALLEVEDIAVHYGRIQAIEGITLSVEEGEVVSLIGANGAGKTTTMRAIAGLLSLSQGSVKFAGDDIGHLKGHQRVARGISLVPEGRGIFPAMTVMENLDMGAYARDRKSGIAEDRERVFDLFPRLLERKDQSGGTLSGGEQQMLAIGRALMARPTLLLLDEPSMGLAPMFIRQIFAIIGQVREQGTTVLLVEQNARVALSVSQYGYVLENGEIRLHGAASELAENPEIRAAYLGM